MPQLEGLSRSTHWLLPATPQMLAVPGVAEPVRVSAAARSQAPAPRMSQLAASSRLHHE